MCFFVYCNMRIIFILFQTLNAICFYLYNLNFYSSSVLEVITILGNVSYFITGLIIVSYFKDIVYLVFYLHLQLGLLLVDDKGDLSTKELISIVILSSFGMLCVLYMLIKYGFRLFGDFNFEDILAQGINNRRRKLLNTLVEENCEFSNTSNKDAIDSLETKQSEFKTDFCRIKGNNLKGKVSIFEYKGKDYNNAYDTSNSKLEKLLEYSS